MASRDSLDDGADGSDDEEVKPPNLHLKTQPLSLACHPRRANIFAVGLCDGSVELRDCWGAPGRPALARLVHDEGAARCVAWSGDALVCGFESGAVVAALLPEALAGGGPVVAVGDDAGTVALYDARLRAGDGAAGVLERLRREDYVADLACAADHLFSAGADGRLGVCDPRRNLRQLRVSDPQDDELLSVEVMKRGSKVVCGTTTGPLVVYSWGRWGDSSDRIVGHPESVDVLLRVDDDVLLSGSSDGVLRVARVMPGLELLGVLGDHGGFPIERLDFSADRALVLSLSHDDVVRFFDARCLDDPTATTRRRRRRRRGDGDGDSDSDDSSAGPAPSRRAGSTTVGGRSKLSLKTKAESFFDGL
ncbi:hypothetical protein JL722_14341 [Aureococcus anophagefferens]|nr:hypothetical protein JL722_14341 [Aureococcus anophagefferens]